MFRNSLPLFAPDEPGAASGGNAGTSDAVAQEPQPGGPESLIGQPSQEPPAGGELPKEPGTEPSKDGEPASGEPQKDGEPPKEPEKRAPEEYADFTAPEGLKLDESTLGDYKALAKEMDLTQEQAQKLLEFGGDKLKAQLEAPYQLWRDTQVKWQSEIKADPEIGGANYDASIKAAGEVFKPGPGNPLVKNEADAQALRRALNVTGAGNNPAVVKFFVRLGKVISEPASLVGKAPKSTQADFLNQLYPSMAKEE